MKPPFFCQKLSLHHQAQQARDTNLPKPLQVSPQQEPVKSELKVLKLKKRLVKRVEHQNDPQTIKNHLDLVANCRFLDTRAKPPRTMKSVWKAPATARGTAMRALWRCFATHIYTDYVYAKGICESTKWKHLLSEDPFMSFQFKKVKKITGGFEVMCLCPSLFPMPALGCCSNQKPFKTIQSHTLNPSRMQKFPSSVSFLLAPLNCFQFAHHFTTKNRCQLPKRPAIFGEP